MTTEAAATTTATAASATATPAPATVAAQTGAAAPVAADATTVSDATLAEIASKPEDDPRFAARFAALSRKEKAIVERERAAKALEAEVAAWKKSKEDGKLNPIALLEQHGLSYSEVTEFLINQGQKKEPTTEEKLEQLQKRLDDEKAARESDAKAKEEAEYQATIDTHKKSIKDFVTANNETFELIHVHDAHELVYEVIEAEWRKTGGPEGGVIIPIEEAAKLVEAYLEEQAQEKVLKLKKFAPKVQTEASGTVEETKTTTPTTLTNRQAATPSAGDASRKYLSDEESKRAAAALLRWK